MPFAGEWCKVWIYFGFVFAWAKGARPRFDTSTDMGLVLIPADAEVDSVIFRLRATDQDADFPLVFEITATITPVVRIDNLPCTLYNKVCQANVILTKRLVPGRLHDFAVRVRDTKGDSNSMQATISVTNATTPRDKIFPHIPSLIMVPENTKPGKELDYLLVRANPWSGKPVYIELWQPKELFTIRQRQTPTQTRGVIILTGELDFETQSMYTLTMYATDPYTEQGKDTRNIAGLSVVVVVQDVQDVPPIFTLAPPLTRINNSVQPGDIIVRVHAEDGDKGVPREIVYGLVSEGNPFTPFFNISETSGEITLARPLDELTQITHVGAPVVLTVVAEEIRRSRDEPPTQATVVDVGFLLGEPGNSPPYFESDNYVATIDENSEPGTVINFGEQYTTKVKDEDIGKAGVFALKLKNNNGTFEITPTVAERTADFVITVRDNALIDYELYKILSFKIVAQEVGPATNLSTSVPVTIFLRDINDNPPVFEEESYEVTLPENVTAGSRVIQVHATDKDTGIYGSIRYTSITGEGNEAFTMDPDTGLITVTMGSSLDREIAARLVLCVEARDEDGNGNAGAATLIINLLDVNDNSPVFEKDVYEFMLNSDLTNFTSPAFIKAIDADAEPPNNLVRYELVHGNYENKFYLNETSGELILRSPITKIRRKKQSAYEKPSKNAGKKLVETPGKIHNEILQMTNHIKKNESLINNEERVNLENSTKEVVTNAVKKRRKRDSDDALYTLTARAYDLGVPHLSSVAKIRIISGIPMEARIMMFVVPGEQPDSKKTAATLAAITGGRVTVLETRPYTQQNLTGSTGAIPVGGQKSIIVARVEQTEPGAPLVDVEKIRETLAANGVGIIATPDVIMNTTTHVDSTKAPADRTPAQTNINDSQTTVINNTIKTVQNEEVTVYKAENKLLIWLLIILGLLMLLAVAALIICCICPGCPFYMAPRKRRVHSSETLVARSDGRPKRHLHRQPAAPAEVSWNGRKQAWSADPTTRNWQFNKRNVKNCSLPGDVAYISGKPNDIQMTIEAQRLRDGPSYGHSRRSRMNEHDRMYMEDVEDQKARRYDTAELDSLQRNEMDRGSDLQHQVFRERYMEPDVNGETAIREQHFYREGNAEVLRLVTRGQVEDTTTSHPHHPHRLHPTTLIVDGKDIILQRFIEDQKSGHELSMQDIEAARSMESHQRFKDVCQQQQPEIILIPDRLEPGHKQHIEEIGPNVQRLVIDHGDYGSRKMERESLRQEKEEAMAGAPIGDRQSPVVAKQHEQPSNAQYSFHDLELARQNALLTRLLLERESRRAGAGGMDSTSYLETQSLPGQVAIATQTDRTAATQTERYVKSRSDNDESDEDSKQRKKLRSRKRTRTLWMKSPIEEEGGPCFDKRLNILRKKVRQVKEGRKVSLEPDVLREISDSLNGNGSSCKAEEEETTRTYRRSTEQTSISYKVLNEKDSGSQSSEGTRKDKRRKSCEDAIEDRTLNVTESTSSPEMKVQREKREKADDKSPRKEVKSKAQQKSDGVMKPSFRILEKEFTMLTRKLSKLGEKKFRESTCSDSTSQEKSDSFSKDSKKDLDQKGSKKVDTSSHSKQAGEGAPGASKAEQKGKQKKESAIARTKQKLKYQQTQVMSTGSSEYDDTLEKPKRMSGIRQETTKQKQSISHAKLKRQKQTAEPSDERIEKRKDGLAKETPKTESKLEKAGKLMTRAPKLAALYRKPKVTEETSTSTEEKKDARTMPAGADFGKKSSTDFSDSSGTQQREGDMFARKVVQKFSDDFVEEPKEEITGGKATTSTEEEERAKMITKQMVVTEKQLSIGDTVQKSKNGLDRTEEKLEERVDIKKVADDSRLDGIQQLIRDSTVIGAILTEEKQLSEAKDIEEASKADKCPSLEIKSTKEEKSETCEREDIKLFRKSGEAKSSDEAEIKKKIEKEEILEKPEKYTAQVVPRELKMYAETDKLQDDSEEQKKDVKSSGKYEYLDPAIEKLSKAFEKASAPSDEVKKMEAEQKVEEMSTEQEQVNIPKSIDVEKEITHEDESKEKAETKREFLDIKVPMEEQINGKMDLIAKIEEPVEKYIKTESLSSDKDSTKQIVVEEPTVHEKKDEARESNKAERKHPEHADVSIPDHVPKEGKEDTVKTISDGLDTIKSDKEVVPKVIVDDYQTEKTIFLGDKTEEDVIKVKDDDQTTESTFLDEDKKITDKKEVIAESITEDSKIIKETTADHKIPIKEAEDHKSDTEIAEDHKFTEEITKDHKIDEEAAKDYKIVGEPVESHKIIEEPIKDSKIDKEATTDGITKEKAIEELKITTEIATDYKIDAEALKDHKIAEETTEGHKMIEKPIKDDRIDNGRTKDHKIVEVVIEDHKIPIQTADSVPKEEAVSDKEIKTSTEETIDKIDDKAIFLGDERTISKEATAIESKIDSQLSEEDKPSPSEKEEIVDTMPGSQTEEKKRSASLEEKDAVSKTDATKEKEATIDDHKINGEKMVFVDSEKQVKDLKEKEEIDTKSDQTDAYTIKEKEYSEDEEKKKHQDKKEEMEPVVDHQKVKEEMIEDVEKVDDHKISEKQIVTPMQKNGDDRISETSSETSKTEEQQLIKKLDDVPEIQDQPSSSKVDEVTTDDITLKKDSSLKMLIAEREDSETVNVSTETPISAEEDTKKGLPEEPKDNIFSEMFRAVHSLADTLTNGKGSEDATIETVTGIPKHPSPDDKSMEKDSHSLLSDDESKTGIEISSKSQIKKESSELAQQTADSEKLEEYRKTDEIIVPIADKLATSFEHESQIHVPIEKKKSEKDENPDEVKSLTSDEPVKTEEVDESLKDQLTPPSKAIDDEIKKDSQDIAEGLFTKTSEASIEHEKVPDNETIDEELSRTGEKGESNKMSGSSQVTELLQTSPQASETTKREKFAFDSLPSETPTDFTKKSEPEMQPELESEAIKLEEVEQFVKQQTFTAEGDKSRAFPEEQSTVESDVRTTVSQDESDKRDVTEVKMDETLPQEAENEEYADVSLPLFTSIIDTVDISEDSDSSSDISRKTTLTTRPYQTPRHRARQSSDDESRQAMGAVEPQDMEDDESATLTIKLIEDERGGPSEKYATREKVEDASIQKPSSTKLTEPMESETSRVPISVQTAFYQDKLMTTANGESTERSKEEATKESSNTAEQTKDTKSESEAKDHRRTSDVQGKPSSVSKLAKADTFKVSDRKTKESEKKKVPPQRKKKSSSGESSEEKTARTQEVAGPSGYRRHKMPPNGQSKQKDGEQAKQLRKTEEEPRRKQSTSKSRVERDKKSSSNSEKHPSPPKTGEIDPSKAQPKYMAWYKKNREEMEKKRAELMATDDEEQLPRWLRRSMKTHKSEAEDKKATDQKTAETTPRTKRKVKPLVNVESEQLKAIVRQGRKLRRAEGGKNEDPPVQIFASSPPAMSQTDPKHRLVQHSEYKYEKAPAPFYLHPPPVPHPSPQLSPEHFEIPPTTEHGRTGEDFDSGIAVSLQGGNRLRHQQLLEKKSVFDIAYSEAAPSQLRSDSTTPPS